MWRDRSGKLKQTKTKRGKEGGSGKQVALQSWNVNRSVPATVGRVHAG